MPETQPSALPETQLQQLAKRFPDGFVERVDGNDYVAHHIVNQRLLQVVGPFDFELVREIRSDLPEVPPDPTGRSARARRGTPAVHNAVTGGVWRLTVTIDGRQVRVEEVGDVDARNKDNDGARLKDASSDALKRCAMRLGLGVHLWAQEHFFLDKALEAKQAEQEQYALPLYDRDGKVARFALVDAGDFERASEHRWFYDGKYPATKIDGKNVRLHRFIMGDPPDDRPEVDHRNLDRLDNRRGNLRWVSHLVNGGNAPSQAGTSMYRGVSWDESRSKWKAQAKYDYVNHFLGRYDTEQEAVQAVAEFWSLRMAEQAPETPQEAPGAPQEPDGGQDTALGLQDGQEAGGSDLERIALHRTKVFFEQFPGGAEDSGEWETVLRDNREWLASHPDDLAEALEAMKLTDHEVDWLAEQTAAEAAAKLKGAATEDEPQAVPHPPGWDDAQPPSPTDGQAATTAWEGDTGEVLTLQQIADATGSHFMHILNMVRKEVTHWATLSPGAAAHLDPDQLVEANDAVRRHLLAKRTEVTT